MKNVVSMENVFHGIYEKWSFDGIPWKTVSMEFYETLSFLNPWNLTS